MYALFGGGHDFTTNLWFATVNAYNTSLQRSIPTALSLARSSHGAASTVTHALFAGGQSSYSAYFNTVVDAYSTVLQRTIPTGLSTGASVMTTASFGDHALITGGLSSCGVLHNAYNTTLTRRGFAGGGMWGPRVPHEYAAATVLGDYALFAGGNGPCQTATTPSAATVNTFYKDLDIDRWCQ